VAKKLITSPSDVPINNRIYYEIAPLIPRGAPFLRKQTRLYFSGSQKYTKHSGRCVGTLWMCNPATDAKSAAPWGPGVEDPTLQRGLWIMDDAQCQANPGAKKGDFIQILNLFYICDDNWDSGLAEHLKSKISQNYREQPCEEARFSWFAWGKDRLRCLSPNCGMAPSPFYYDGTQLRLVRSLPQPSTHPVHPYAGCVHRQYPKYRLDVANEISRHLRHL
jgi:hypothetical protein